MTIGLVATSAVVLSAHSPQRPEYARQLESAEPEFIAEQLDLLVRDEISQAAQILLYAIGERELREHIPVLKRFAIDVSQRESGYHLTGNVLHCLWRLGEPKEYFLDNVRRHGENKWLAYYSIYMLAYDPDEHVIQVIRGALEGVSDGALTGARSIPISMNGLMERYQALTTTADKVALLAQSAYGGWNPFFVEPYNVRFGELRPRAVWARQQLLILYEESPGEVEEQLVALEEDPSPSGIDDSLATDFISYLRAYLKRETAKDDAVEQP